MEIICDQCERKLNVPDEKIPEGRKVTVTCPGCKQKITFEKQTEEASADDAVCSAFFWRQLRTNSLLSDLAFMNSP